MDTRRYAIDGTESPSGPYRWPSLRSKFFPITCMWVGLGPRLFAFDWGPNTYHGCHWWLTFGPLLALGGRVEIITE